MKNLKSLILIYSFILGFISYGQNEVPGITFTKTTLAAIDTDKVYDKKTGSQISESEFYKLVEENPNLTLESEFDDEGKVIRHLYDPRNQNGELFNQKINKLSPNDTFPNFKMTTIDKKKINLNELRGKLVILRFELEAVGFRFKKHEIQELDEKINALENQNDIEAIIIFQAHENEVKKGFDLNNSNFETVANGHNFMEKFGITRFPTTILIDQNGKLIEKYSYSEDIVLEEHIKK